jgi:hypothetical protein
VAEQCTRAEQRETKRFSGDGLEKQERAGTERK